MEMKFVTAKKPAVGDVVVQRRQRLVRRIEQQVSLMLNAKEGAMPRSSWAWMDDAGRYLVPINYGRQPIELKKGMFAIQCDSVDDVSTVFVAVRSMVLNGELDQQLAQALQDIRTKFGNGKSASDQ